MRVLRRRARRVRHIEVGPYSPMDLPALASLVDHHLRQAFPGWTAGQDLLAEVLARPVGRMPLGEFGRLKNWCVLCARDGDRLLGAMQMCRVPPQAPPNGETPPGTAHLAWMFFLPEYPEVGEVLARRAAVRAGAWRCPRLRAWEIGLGGFTGMGASGLSAAWPHLEAPLGHVRLQAVTERVLWTGDLPPEPLPPPEGIEVRVDAAEHGWRARALSEGAAIGECRLRAVSSYCGHHAAASAAFLEVLQVDPEWRRQGIGAALARAAGGAARAANCRTLAAALPAGDAAASALARRLGWRIADRLRTYGRQPT